MRKPSELSRLLLQPHPLTSVMQLSITIMGISIAAAALISAMHSLSDERNARLVELGLKVLMVDPVKEESVRPARAWALDLIDANAGVRFSAEARRALMEGPLRALGTDLGSVDMTVSPSSRDKAPR